VSLTSPASYDPLGVNVASYFDLQKVGALVFALGVLLVASALYRSHGLKLQCILIAYVTSLFSTQLVVKVAVGHYPYPFTVTAYHFASTWLVTCIFFRLGYTRRESLVTMAAEAAGRSRFTIYCSKLAPPAVALAASVVLSNAALMHIGASLNGIIGITTPLVTACISAICGARFVPLAWLGILVAASGDVVAAFDGFRAAVSTGMNGNAASVGLGVALAAGATTCRATKAVLQERLMGQGLCIATENGISLQQIEPLQLVSLQAPFMTLVAGLLMLTVEGFAGLLAVPSLTHKQAGIVMLSCSSATCMNFSGMLAIRMLGAPASQLAGKLNVFVVAALSSAWFGEILTYGEAAGGVVALAGLAVFEKAQKRADKKAAKQEMADTCDSGRNGMRFSEEASKLPASSVVPRRRQHNGNGAAATAYEMHVV